jgi:hypothetical protein
MTRSALVKPDPKLDLVLERVIDVPRELVWAAWTRPEHVKHWLTPRPWTVSECEIDLRPGGMFRFVMRSPEGFSQRHMLSGGHRAGAPDLDQYAAARLPPGAELGPRRPAVHRDHHAGTARHRHPLRGDCNSPRRSGMQTARGNGIPRRLGQGARPAGRARDDDVSGGCSGVSRALVEFLIRELKSTGN